MSLSFPASYFLVSFSLIVFYFVYLKEKAESKFTTTYSTTSAPTSREEGEKRSIVVSYEEHNVFNALACARAIENIREKFI